MIIPAIEPFDWVLDIVDHDMVEYVQVDAPEEIANFISFDDQNLTVHFNGSP